MLEECYFPVLRITLWNTQGYQETKAIDDISKKKSSLGEEATAEFMTTS